MAQNVSSTMIMNSAYTMRDDHTDSWFDRNKPHQRDKEQILARVVNS